MALLFYSIGLLWTFSSCFGPYHVSWLLRCPYLRGLLIILFWDLDKINLLIKQGHFSEFTLRVSHTCITYWHASVWSILDFIKGKVLIDTRSSYFNTLVQWTPPQRRFLKLRGTLCTCIRKSWSFIMVLKHNPIGFSASLRCGHLDNQYTSVWSPKVSPLRARCKIRLHLVISQFIWLQWPFWFNGILW